MVSFYPGPSRIYSGIPKYFREAYESGILSINHRSSEFMDLYKGTAALLKSRLEIPGSYEIFFTTSATENWEILAQSLTRKSSLHIYNGAFGERWYKYAKHIHQECRGIKFGINEELNVAKLKIPSRTELIALTHNETSNGTQIDLSTISEIRKKYPNTLICLDATSSMGGIKLNFKHGDAWFASVQKCFGLPAGMGILICSPLLIERSKKIGERGRYNSFSFLLQNRENWQTPFTPNVSNIYLLNRVLKDSADISAIEDKLNSRYQKWMEIFRKLKGLQRLIKNDRIRSRTVLAVSADAGLIKEANASAKKDGFLLGSGYGDLKETTFRIANFPALLDKEVKGLQNFFIRNYS